MEKKQDTSIRNAVMDIAKSLRDVFKQHPVHTREMAWERISSKKGDEQVQKLIRNPNRQLNTFNNIAFKEWFESVDPRPREAFLRAISAAVNNLKQTAPEVFEFNNTTGEATTIKVSLDELKIKLEDRGLVPPKINSEEFATYVTNFMRK